MTDESMPEVCWRQTCPALPEDLLRVEGTDVLRVFRVPIVNTEGRVDVYAESYSCAAHQPRILIIDDSRTDPLRAAIRSIAEGFLSD